MSPAEFDTTIDRDSYIPLYIQVMDALREYIENGDTQPGEQLPGEPELCRLFDVSRTVIRQALRELEYEGLIYRNKGRGTFVSEPKIRESLFEELTGFYQDMEAKGHPPVSRVLKQEVVPAGPKIAAFLQIETDSRVIQIDRLRYVNDEPIVLVTTYLPYALCPGLAEVDLAERSLYAYLESEYGLQIARGHRVLEAVPANKMEAELLGVKKGAPLIMLDSVSYLADGTPLEYYHAVHRGDRSRFEVELIRTRQPGRLAEKLLLESQQP
jgi:GntR family transcriptional regulator